MTTISKAMERAREGEPKPAKVPLKPPPKGPVVRPMVAGRVQATKATLKVIDRVDVPARPVPPPPAARPSTREVEIDFKRLEGLGMLAPESKRGRLAEEYRRIKHPLLSNVKGKAKSAGDQNNLIMLTSALPGEGKTFTSYNLAMKIGRASCRERV